MCVIVSKKAKRQNCKILLNGETINQLHFSFKGNIEKSDSRCDQEIKKIIAIANTIFQDLSRSLKNINLTLQTRITVKVCHEWSALV